MKLQLARFVIDTEEELISKIQYLWDSLTMSYINSLIDSFENHLKMIIDYKGCSIAHFIRNHYTYIPQKALKDKVEPYTLLMLLMHSPLVFHWFRGLSVKISLQPVKNQWKVAQKYRIALTISQFYHNQGINSQRTTNKKLILPPDGLLTVDAFDIRSELTHSTSIYKSTLSTTI